MKPSSRRFLLPLLALLPTCDRAPTETWGFVATLGNDTTSVERITRTGNRIVSDAVGRSPRVVHRHWEATLDSDGSVTRWSMDTRIANAPPGEAALHHELALREGALHIVRHAPRDTMDRTFASTYARTVPWNAFLYGTYELLFQAARGLSDSTRIGQYFFEGWSEGKLGFAQVRRLADTLVAISSTGLSGSGLARVDAQGRMLSYSGAGTTYLQEARRITEVPDIDAIFERFAADERARGSGTSLSVRDTMRAAIHGANLIVDYGRPLARGRTLLGGVIPYGRVWRTGANAATHLELTAPLRLAGVPLDSGRYTLWTLPSRDGVQLIINRQTGQWGTGYAPRHDIARVAMLAESSDSAVERFTIRVDGARSRLVMEWGTFRWSAPVEPSR